MHRPSKLKVLGGLAYRQGDEGLLKTQVWQCLTEAWKTPGISTGTDSLADYATSHFPFCCQPPAADCFLQPCVMFFCHLIWKYSQAICHGHWTPACVHCLIIDPWRGKKSHHILFEQSSPLIRSELMVVSKADVMTILYQSNIKAFGMLSIIKLFEYGNW